MTFYVSDGLEFVERTSKSLESLMEQYRALDVRSQHGLGSEEETMEVDYTFYVSEAAELKKVGNLTIHVLTDTEPTDTHDEDLDLYESFDSLEAL